MLLVVAQKCLIMPYSSAAEDSGEFAIADMTLGACDGVLFG